MTLAEKTNITCGSGYDMGRCVGNSGSALRVGLPQLCLQDSALGIRNSDHNTAFPAGITVGATWDKSLTLARGVALGAEFRGKGINVFLGPTVGPLGRKPRGGRNWEGFGADPVLQAVGGALTIQGVQSQGVIATIKHYILNEQEMYRMYSPFQPGYSSNIDDRTLHELYLWPFAEGIRAGVGAVMAAYNAVNGSACSQNSYLLNGILKDELGFQGFVVSDWLAQISGVASSLAGLDMSMPGDGLVPLLGDSYWMYELSRAVLNGTVPVDRLNDMATRIVATWYQMRQDENYPPPNFSTNTEDGTGPLYPGALFSPFGVVNEFVDVQDDHANIARNISRDAITMLKNLNNTLPLQTNASLKIFGTDAQKNPDGINSCSDQGCDKGTLGMGWGSGTARYPYLDSPIDAITSRASNVTFYNSDTFPSGLKAAPRDIALVFINADSGENYITVSSNPGDRTTSGLSAWHNGDALVKAAAATYSTVIVIAHTVGPILLEEWIDLPSVKSVLFAHLPGQEAGESLTAILFGDVSPSGHLPYTIPHTESEYPPSVNLVYFEPGQPQDTYTEGLYIDYRHFNAHNITPRYAFGHGLSYTTFTFTNATITPVTPLTSVPPPRSVKGATPVYSTVIPPTPEAYWPANFPRIWRYLYSWLEESDADAAAAAKTNNYTYPTGYTTTPKPPPPAGGSQGGNPALWDTAYTLSITVTNTGGRPGKAVAQLYVQFPANITYDTPLIQLRDFAKTRELGMGESEVLSMNVTRKDLSVWDTELQDWVIPDVGRSYTVWIGEASDNLGWACWTGNGVCEGGLGGPNV
ncbi:glycoside hydrolase family 3 protein [Lepidopterella palustris CBS 459.81]|uniref:beta-glucosidase n=1 Tax=Lepidopterella palustris CBS 459.81 TaxID=1314670 RepID=A0A8E2ECU7_9PEZI|nr:glycoside hydrolase family 3 protein [Lepidopterella palustris CBS 459.81]